MEEFPFKLRIWEKGIPWKCVLGHLRVGSPTGASPSDLEEDKERSHILLSFLFLHPGIFNWIFSDLLHQTGPASNGFCVKASLLFPAQNIPESPCAKNSRRNFPKIQPKPALAWLEFPFVLFLFLWEQIPTPSQLRCSQMFSSCPSSTWNFSRRGAPATVTLFVLFSPILLPSYSHCFLCHSFSISQEKDGIKNISRRILSKIQRFIHGEGSQKK